MKNSPKTNFIFNEHFVDWNKPLFLVEGVFDAIMLRRNAVPILGKRGWAALGERYREVHEKAPEEKKRKQEIKFRNGPT